MWQSVRLGWTTLAETRRAGRRIYCNTTISNHVGYLLRVSDTYSDSPASESSPSPGYRLSSLILQSPAVLCHCEQQANPMTVRRQRSCSRPTPESQAIARTSDFRPRPSELYLVPCVNFTTLLSFWLLFVIHTKYGRQTLDDLLGLT